MSENYTPHQLSDTDLCSCWLKFVCPVCRSFSCKFNGMIERSIIKNKFMSQVGGGIIKWHDAIMEAEHVRSQLTCCSVSEHFLVFGTKTGTLYIHDRKTLQRLLMVSSAELTPSKSTSSTLTKSIVQIDISPNEEFIAVADSEHWVHILEFATNSEKTGVVPKNPKLLASNKEHVKSLLANNAAAVVSDNQQQQPAMPPGVTCLCWASNNLKIFSGDSNGFVYEFENSAERRKKSTLFISSAPAKVLKEEGAIVELDASDMLLLVSSTKRCVIVNLKDQKYSGIGSKPRDGIFGACFLHTPDRKLKKENPQAPFVEYVFAARPGRRVWCADKLSCKVLSTLKFPAISTAPNLRISTLKRIGPYIVSWNAESVCVIDVVRVKVLETRTDIAGDIISAASHGNELYIVHGANVVSKLYAHVETKPEPVAPKAPVALSPPKVQEESLIDVSFPVVSLPQEPLQAKAPISPVTQPLQPIPQISQPQQQPQQEVDAPSVIDNTVTVAPPPVVENVPLVIIRKKKDNKRRRKTERLIEFDEPAANQIKATAGRVTSVSKKKDSSSLDGSIVSESVPLDSETGISDENRTELDAITEASDLSDTEEPEPSTTTSTSTTISTTITNTATPSPTEVTVPVSEPVTVVPEVTPVQPVTEATPPEIPIQQPPVPQVEEVQEEILEHAEDEQSKDDVDQRYPPVAEWSIETLEGLLKKQNRSQLERFMAAHSKSENWLTLIKAVQRLKAEDVIHIDQVITMMCLIEGSVPTLQILKDCTDVDCKGLSTVVYRRICELATIEAKQNKLKHELLETIDSYMWSSKEVMISPQVQTILGLLPSASSVGFVDKQTECKRNIHLISHLYQSLPLLTQPSRNLPESHESNQIEEINLTFEHDHSLPRFIEDWSTHWGIDIQSDHSNRCHVCRLPVKEKKGPEVFIFPCGHAFHTACVPVAACVICHEDSFNSLLS